MFRRILPLGVLAAAYLFVPATACALECTAAVLKATAKYEQKLLGCFSKAQFKGDEALFLDCASKATVAYDTAFAKSGDCGATSDVCDAATTVCLEAIAGAVPGTVGDKCVAKKIKAAGKAAGALLGCYSKAADKQVPVDPVCTDKANAKLEAALVKAGSCEDGGALTDLVFEHCLAPVATVDLASNVTGACVAVDECFEGTDNCDANATCTDQSYLFSCACDAGYTGDGVTCTDIDECTENTDNCAANATCTNSEPGFSCECNPGFTGDGVTCTDIDECGADLDDCDVNATCTNTAPGFSCSCNPGYGGDGVTCGALLTCPCWDEHSLASLVAALENGAGYPSKTCTSGPGAGQANISAQTVPYNVNTVASIYTTVDPNPLNACCAYIDGSPQGCVPYLSNEVVQQCGAEIVAAMPYVSWCP